MSCFLLQMYFYVMQSIYHPDDRINLRYDVKGCLAGRYQQVSASVVLSVVLWFM